MENKNLYNSLRYGHIIKLNYNSDKDNDSNIFFFVNNINKNTLELINERNEIKTFSLNKEGGLDEIDEIIIVYTNEVGYAVSNNLNLGKNIKISFVDGMTYVEGEIINLEEDMITVKTQEDVLLYIDFQYRGLIKEYNIQEIRIIPELNNKFQGNNDIIEVVEDIQTPQYEGFIYSFEQQVNDYIEKNQLSIKNKSKVLQEVSKYSMLLEEYTDIDEGVMRIPLPENQIIASFLHLQPGLVLPVTSYANKDLYITDETVLSFDPDSENTEKTNWKYSVDVKDESEVFSEKNYFKDNVKFTNVKRMRNHKKVRVHSDSRAILINKTMNPVDDKPFFFSIKKNSSNEVAYDTFHIDHNYTFLIDGIAFPNKSQLEVSRKQHQSTEILSRSTSKNIMGLKSPEKMRTLTKAKISKKQLFHNSKITYYPLTKDDSSFKDYLSRLKYRINDLYSLILKSKESNIYSSLNNLAMFNISKLGVEDFAFLSKHVKNSIKEFKNEQNYLRNVIKRYPKSQKYKNVYNDLIHNLIVRSYKIKHYGTKQPSELFDEMMIDNSKLLLSHLKYNNKNLSFDINETEISQYINKVRLEINGDLNQSNINKISYAKTYENKRDLLNDINKVILRNTNINENGILESIDPLQILYNRLVDTTMYTGNLRMFIKNIDILLKSLYSNEHNFEELKELVFTDEDDKENIIKVLMKEIVSLKIRKLERCYVKQENKYYTYDGKTWNSLQDFNDQLGNKKLLKSKNTLDELLPLKTKIIHDFVIDMIHKNEQNTDKKDINEIEKSQALAIRVILIRNERYRKIMKYNSQKIDYGKLLDYSKEESKMIYSDFAPLLHSILAVDELSKKYNLIQRYVSLFTIDKGDIGWYYCIKTNTKLVPKYLIRLCNAFHNDIFYHKTINEICQSEGYLSEDGDAWIHKESGFVIKNLNFDNTDFTEAGFQELMTITNNQHPDYDVNGFEEETEEIGPSQIVDTGDKKTFKRLKMVADLTLRIMKIVGITVIKTQNMTTNTYEKIHEIYVKASKKESKTKKKDKELNSRLFMYSVLSYILVYAQNNHIQINSSFGKCSLSFEGFPLEDDSASRGGINYLVCIIISLAEKFDNLGQTKITPFKNVNKNEISDEFVNFITNHSMNTEIIGNMIWQGRLKRDSSPIQNKATKYILRMKRFRPQLKNEELVDNIIIPSAVSNNIYIDYKLKETALNAINMKIEAFINKIMLDEKPILKTQFEAPYMVNFCCNNKEFILNHLPKTNVDRETLIKLLNESYDLQELIKVIESKYTGTSMTRSSKFENNKPINSSESFLYSKTTIFSYIETIFNFNNSKDIPNHLRDFGILKPDEDYYNRISESRLSRKDKIKILEEKGYVFEHELMLKIMTHDQRIRTEDEKNNQSKNKLQETQYINDIFDIFKSEFMNSSSRSEQINNFDTNITILKKDYLQYLEDYIKSSDRRKILTQLQKWSEPTNNADKEMIISQLYNINYALINMIPRAIAKKAPTSNDITTEQWNLAGTHADKIQGYHVKFYEHFDMIDDDKFKSSISIIGDFQTVLRTSIFNQNIDSKYYFLLYLFYKLINTYTQERSNMKTSIEVNNGIIRFINAFVKVNSFSYENASVKTTQIKNAEKRQKTDQLRNLKPQEREIEKQKMVLKLGDWGYGNQKRVFKYYKDFYDEDTDRAGKIKDIESEMYADLITNGDIGETFESPISPEMNMSNAPDADGIVYDQDGSEQANYE
jgi:hypothetical protein